MDPLDFYKGEKGFKKSLNQFLEEKKHELKEQVKKVLPDPMDKMLDTQEGTYALIAAAIVIAIFLLKIAGMTLRFFSRLILFVSILAMLYFGYLYFVNHT